MKRGVYPHSTKRSRGVCKIFNKIGINRYRGVCREYFLSISANISDYLGTTSRVMRLLLTPLDRSTFATSSRDSVIFLKAS